MPLYRHLDFYSKALLHELDCILYRWWSVLTQRILNFIHIDGHKEEDLGIDLEKCLKEWEIEKVFTITIDNAATNDTTMNYLDDNIV